MAATPISDPQKAYVDAISAALKKAKLDKTYTPSSEAVSKMMNSTNNFVPGLADSYRLWLAAKINAAKAEYGANSPEVGYYTALQAVYEIWNKDHLRYEDLDTSKALGGTEGFSKVQDTVRQVLADETAALEKAASEETGLEDRLYGKGGKDNASKGSLAFTLNDKTKALQKAETALATATAKNKVTPKIQATYDAAKTAFDTAQKTFDDAKNKYSSTLSTLDKALISTTINYNKNAGTIFTNYLQGIETPVVKPGATQADKDAAVKAAAEAATNTNVTKAVEEYKKTGNIPNVDQSISGQVTKAIDDYEQIGRAHV